MVCVEEAEVPILYVGVRIPHAILDMSMGDEVSAPCIGAESLRVSGDEKLSPYTYRYLAFSSGFHRTVSAFPLPSFPRHFGTIGGRLDCDLGDTHIYFGSLL